MTTTVLQASASGPNARSRRKNSWSSSGDTSYYDARDHLTGDDDDSGADIRANRAAVAAANAAFGAVETSQDLQAAHDRATAFYENAAFVGDNSGDGTLNAPAGGYRKKQPRKSKRLPSHLTRETNVDSTTTADEAGAVGQDDIEETDDDFGFKFRPAIAPPRPLQSPGKPALGSGGSLTLEDTLSMKRPQPVAVIHAPGAITSSGILLETNLDSELDDNSSIPSSYYPDAMVKLPPQPNGFNGSLAARSNGGMLPPEPSHQQQALQPPPARVAAAFQFNTAVREEDETTTTTTTTEEEATAVEEPTRRTNGPMLSPSEASESATEVDLGGGGLAWSRSLGLRDEVPRMATWSSSRPPNSPSLTVIETAATIASRTSQPYRSPTATSVSLSSYSQAPPVLKQQQLVQLQLQSQQSRRLQQQPPQPLPSRMIARLDTDFEVSTDEGDFTETTPGDMAILEYSRALEEADRMRHAAAANYVFAQPPGSHQFTGSVPEYINYTGRDSATIGSVGLRAKSMNTLTLNNTLMSSRNSLGGSLSGKVLLTPGRARRASLRRSRLGLMDSGMGLGSSHQGPDTSGNAQISGNSYTNFALTGSQSSDELRLPEVQHHGPLRSSTGPPAKSRMTALCGPCDRCIESCCPNAPRKKLVRWVLIGGICLCAVLLAVTIAVIVVSTRPKDPATTAV